MPQRGPLNGVGPGWGVLGGVDEEKDRTEKDRGYVW